MIRLVLGPPLRQLASVSIALRVLPVLILALVAIAIVYQVNSERSAVIEDTERQISRLDMVFAEQTGRAVEAADLLVNGTIETLQAQQAAGAPLTEVEALLRRRMQGVRQLNTIIAVDAAGNVLVNTQVGRSDTPSSVIETMLARYRIDPHAGLLISRPFQVAGGQWSALLCRPILAPNGMLGGMVGGSIALNYFEDFYRAVDLAENGAINLHLRDGTVLARFPHQDTIIGSSYGDLPPFTQILSHAQAGTMLMDSPIDGSLRVIAIRALRAFPLAVMVSVDQGRVLVDWRYRSLALIGAAFLLVVVISVLLFALSRRSWQKERLLEETRAAHDIAERAKDRLMQQITERERAEGALRQAQRIDAIGQLTGGIAHDFNNLLTVVLGNIEILQRESPHSKTIAARLNAIRAAAQRGATLTGHLLAFARRQPLMPRPLDLNETLRTMRDLLESAAGANIVLTLSMAPYPWLAMADRNQIELVVLNLVLNGRDAMPGGGTITIETANQVRTEGFIGDGPPPGDYVAITVRDTGAGIPSDILPRIFEPFFTTKPPGAGSGLGLSQVFGTVRQSGGEVRIKTEVGAGTAVTVDLPRAVKLPRSVIPTGPAMPGATRQASILLVDDDDGSREVTAALLNNLGHVVQDVSDGKAALALLNTEGAPIDLLLTDLVMPEMNGTQLANEALTLRPSLPVVFISGYADEVGDIMERGTRLVSKPIKSADLQSTIESALSDSYEALPSA